MSPLSPTRPVASNQSADMSAHSKIQIETDTPTKAASDAHQNSNGGTAFHLRSLFIKNGLRLKVDAGIEFQQSAAGL